MCISMPGEVHHGQMEVLIPGSKTSVLRRWECCGALKKEVIEERLSNGTEVKSPMTLRGRRWTSKNNLRSGNDRTNPSVLSVDHGHIIRRHAQKGSPPVKPSFRIPQNDPNQKILVQIQQTAVQSQRSLNISRQQTSAKERERRILQLTIDEINSIGKDVNMYKGVGKM